VASAYYSRGYKNRATAEKKYKSVAIFSRGLEIEIFLFLSFFGHKGHLVCMQAGCFSQLAHSARHRKPRRHAFFTEQIFDTRCLVKILQEKGENFLLLIMGGL
jgi:hypothetical protein